MVDAETGQPIQGVLAVTQWTKTRGLGFTYSSLHKITETVSDKDGKVKLVGAYWPFLDPPDIVVYKDGYVAWRNDFIYPDFKRRKDFKYKSGLIIKMERWEASFSYEKHHSFIDLGILTKKCQNAPRLDAGMNGILAGGM